MREFRKWFLIVLILVVVIGWNVGCKKHKEIVIDAEAMIKAEPPLSVKRQIDDFLNKILDRIMQQTYNGDDYYLTVRIAFNNPLCSSAAIYFLEDEIFINKKLILAARNEAEIAFVIAHEIGHIMAPDFLPPSLWPQKNEAFFKQGYSFWIKGYKHGYSPRLVFDFHYRLFLCSFKHELIDRVGIELMAKAGYNTYSTVSILRLTMEDKDKDKDEKTERRLSAYRNAREHFRNDQKKWILFVPDDLEKIKEICRKFEKQDGE